MVSRITDKILPLAKEWQNRLLSPLYPIIFLDGIMFSVRQDGVVVKKTAYVVFAINLKAGKKSWYLDWRGGDPQVLDDHPVGFEESWCEDILIASVDGLNGFEEAIRASFPRTEIQRCIVHQIRNSTRFVN